MKKETPGGVSPGASTVVDDRMKLIALVDSIQASESDRRFFEKFPKRRHRVRRAFASELKLQGVFHKPFENDLPIYVAVCGLAPGVRCRLGFSGFGIPSGLGEEEAATLFDIAVKRSREASEIIAAIIAERRPQ